MVEDSLRKRSVFIGHRKSPHLAGILKGSVCTPWLVSDPYTRKPQSTTCAICGKVSITFLRIPRPVGLGPTSAEGQTPLHESQYTYTVLESKILLGRNPSFLLPPSELPCE